MNQLMDFLAFGGLTPIAIISRPKLNGLGEHWGVRLPNGTVVHNTAEHGLQVVAFKDFAKNKPIKEVKTLPFHSNWTVLARVQWELSNPKGYDPITNNCESFANRVVSGMDESPQVKGWLMLALFGTAIWAAT